MKYRDRFTIVAAILEAVEEHPATRTRIMYSAYLSYAQMKEYVKAAIAHGLMTEFADESLGLTEDGKKFLALDRAIQKLLGSQNATPLVEVPVPG